jgi:hypothetical protein
VFQERPYLSPAIFEFDAAKHGGRLRHGGNPVLTWRLGNVVGKADRRGNLYPTKSRPDQKIDAAVALWSGREPGWAQPLPVGPDHILRMLAPPRPGGEKPRWTISPRGPILCKNGRSGHCRERITGKPGDDVDAIGRIRPFIRGYPNDLSNTETPNAIVRV